MPLDVQDPEISRLVHALCEATGESPAEAIRRALEERLKREQDKRSSESLVARIRHIQESVTALPVLDHRPVDEVLGYDDRGLPG